MTKKDAIKRAKDFLNNHIGVIYDWDEDHSNYSEFDYSQPDKPYFVYCDGEYRGYFCSCAKFYSKTDVNDLIQKQLECFSDQKKSYQRWDNIVIFDIKKNKIVIPKI